MNVRSVVSSTRAPGTASTAVSQPRPVVGVGGLDGDVADRVIARDLYEVDGADRAAGVADRAGDLPEHPGAVIDLDAQRQAVLSTRCWRHAAR